MSASIYDCLWHAPLQLARRKFLWINLYVS
uniref:Uncharacterized protein n=1 Tax=Arundo donax TaxID=35708 RepID=A0A0A8Z8L7_ARUDO